MKKKILITLLAIITFATTMPVNINAKHNNYYTLTGIIHNFSYKTKYTNGKVLKGKGYDIYTSDGNIWQITDTDTNVKFKENTKVKVKFYINQKM